MPVELTLTVPDIPTPPAGYLVVAIEVRTGAPEPGRELYPHTTDGYESAANKFLRRAVTGQELVAIAWFADKPLTECAEGRERIVSRFDADGVCWSEWVPEEKTGGVQRTTRAHKRSSPAKVNKLHEATGRTDLGDLCEPKEEDDP